MDFYNCLECLKYVKRPLMLLILNTNMEPNLFRFLLFKPNEFILQLVKDSKFSKKLRLVKKIGYYKQKM